MSRRHCSETEGVADAGLQPERTELAWRRTALALAFGSLVAIRIVPDALHDPRWIFAGVLGVAVGAMMWILARTRYRRVTRAMHGPDHDEMPGGAVLALISAGVTALAVGATIVVLSTAN